MGAKRLNREEDGREVGRFYLIEVNLCRIDHAGSFIRGVVAD